MKSPLSPRTGPWLLAGFFGLVSLLPELSRGDMIQGTFALPLADQEVSFFYRVSKVRGPRVLILSLHRNENTAFPLVEGLLQSYQGQFVGIDSPGGRRLSLKGSDNQSYTIDPNRMFSKDGIESDLKRFSIPRPEAVDDIRAFSKKYVEKVGIQRGIPIIAVHNNTNGGYSIASYEKGGSESGATADLSINPEWDADDFVLVTNQKHFEALKALGFNTILQDNRKAPDDGSLSVYCGRNGIDYFNVEAEFGHSRKQGEMLHALFALLTGRNLPVSNTPAPSPDQPAGPPPIAGKKIESGANRLGDPKSTDSPAAATNATPATPPVMRGKPVESGAIKLGDPKE